MSLVKAAASSMLGLALLATGCGGTEPAPAARPTSAPTVTVTVTTTPEPSPSDAMTETGPSQVGSWWRTPEGNRIRVLEYRRDAPGSYGVQGERWDAVLVKTCVGMADGVALSWLPWRLTDAKDGEFEASGETAGDFLAPQYPFAGDRVVPRDRCVRGWIYFGVPKSARISGVNYANDAGSTHDWII